MTVERESDEGTLTAVMDGKGAPFEAAGETFIIRQPTTEEYDDALAIQNLVLRRTLALPEMAELKSCRAATMNGRRIRLMIAATELEFADGAGGPAEGRARSKRSPAWSGRWRSGRWRMRSRRDRAILARDRWLTMRLLCDAEGRPVFDTKAPDVGARWEALPLAVKEAARPAVWAMLALVRTAPFRWERSYAHQGEAGGAVRAVAVADAGRGS